MRRIRLSTDAKEPLVKTHRRLFVMSGHVQPRNIGLPCVACPAIEDGEEMRNDTFQCMCDKEVIPQKTSDSSFISFQIDTVPTNKTLLGRRWRGALNMNVNRVKQNARFALTTFTYRLPNGVSHKTVDVCWSSAKRSRKLWNSCRCLMHTKKCRVSCLVNRRFVGDRYNLCFVRCAATARTFKILAWAFLSQELKVWAFLNFSEELWAFLIFLSFFEMCTRPSNRQAHRAPHNRRSTIRCSGSRSSLTTTRNTAQSWTPP